MNSHPESNRDPRDDAEEVDRAFAQIISHWSQTAQVRSQQPPAPDGQSSTDQPGPTQSGQPTQSAAPTDPDPRQPDADAAGSSTPGDPHDQADAPCGRDPQASADQGLPTSSAQPSPRRPRSIDEVFGAGGDVGFRVHIPPEEPEEDFVPGPPAALPAYDPPFWGALIGLVAGPLWLIWLSVVATGSHPAWSWAAIATTLAGFGLLITKLPARRDPEDEDDDGAVV